MNEWREVEIGEVCQVGDGAHAKVERKVSGVPYLTSKNFDRGKLKLDDVDFISEQDYERLFTKESKAVTRPQDGDVLMGIIGTFGNGYRYKPSDKFGVSSSVALLRPDQSMLNPDFLEYVVNSDRFRATHEAYSSGSVQGYTNIPTIKRMLIPLPPLAEQRRIAAILSTLDAKIDLLRRQNITLEAIAQTLFKRWFVDFEFPDAHGRPYRSAGGPMQASELGEIPVGWRVGVFKDLVDLTTGKGLKRSEFTTNGLYPVLGANGEMGRTDKYLTDDKLIVTGRVGTLGVVRLTRGKVWISDNVLISKPKQDFSTVH
ncbi:MAG: restriction endonuclease subunit S [Anaerolineae bacterium]|nr:restriction endonuclease subunit S [Anaerolineae bacterium]